MNKLLRECKEATVSRCKLHRLALVALHSSLQENVGVVNWGLEGRVEAFLEVHPLRKWLAQPAQLPGRAVKVKLDILW